MWYYNNKTNKLKKNEMKTDAIINTSGWYNICLYSDFKFEYWN